MKPKKFWVIQEDILKKRKSESRSYEIGKWRQEKVASTLKKLKDEGRIFWFYQTGDLSYQDVAEGFDFYIVLNDGTKRRICRLSVTGIAWLNKHRHQHPEIPVIDVGLGDTEASVKNKIIKAINL